MVAETSKYAFFPRAAVAVVLTHNGRTLFGQRKVSANQFEWQIPGGWINNGETPQQAARREVGEETGLNLVRLELVAVTNNIFSSLNHSVSLCFEAECPNPEQLRLKEPEKCLGWYWEKWLEVEGKLYLPLANLKNSDYRPFIRDKGGTGIQL